VFYTYLGNSSFQTEVDGMFLRRKSPGFWVRIRNVIWPKMGLSRAWRYLVHRMARLSASPHAIALGFAAGAFASFTPFIGLHFILAGLLAFALRASILASAIGTVVGNPLTFPFIWLATYNVGAAFLGREAKAEVVLDLPLDSESAVSEGMLAFAGGLMRQLEPVILPMVIGGTLLGLACAAACYFIVRLSVDRFKKRRKSVRAGATTS
jgi:uncharacterized protein (DUF2062 family)